VNKSAFYRHYFNLIVDILRLSGAT
jgi:hypothetical protein